MPKIKMQAKFDIPDEIFEQSIEKALKNIPDYVLVVRCKGCKHWTDALLDCTEHRKFCEIGFYMIGADGFCSLGERRAEDGK